MSSEGSQLDRPVPDWLLERLARGDLPPERAAEVRRRLEAEGAAGLERLASLERSDRDILAEHPPAVVSAEVRRRAAVAQVAEGQRARWPLARWQFALPTLAVGAMAVLLLVPRGTGTVVPEGPGTQPAVVEGPEVGRIKGPLDLSVHVKRGNDHKRLPAGAAVRPGDQLQLSYRSDGKRFGVVASVDTRGTVTLHLPEAPGAAPALALGKETRLPHAFELDDSPGAERFVFVAGDQPFTTDMVAEALKPGGAPLPEGLKLVDLTLQRSTRESGNIKDKP
jgi:anti-sigma factor RsiW